MLDQRRTRVPGRVRRKAGDVVALEARDRHCNEAVDADAFCERRIVFDDLVEARLAVIDEVHLVDGKHDVPDADQVREIAVPPRSEEHTSELQSLMRISYAIFRLKK